MHLLLVWWLFFPALASISNAADSAASAWSQLQALNDKVNEKVPVGTNAVEFYGPREKALHDAAAKFVNQFPNDARKPEAVLWKIATTDFQGSAEQRTTLLLQNEVDGRLAAADTAVPSDLRLKIERAILTQWLENPDLITTADRATDLEGRLADLVRANPTEPRAASFELDRADLMLRFDHERGLALLQDFINGPDHNLANAAKIRLQKSQMIGKPVDLQFTAVDGSSVDLRTLRGNIVLVDFWATWCPDCIRDMPTIRQTYQKYKDKGFAILGISLDKDAQALANFVAKKLIPWPQYFVGNGSGNDYATNYGVRAIPEMWLINQRGEVVDTDVTVQQLDQKIRELMSSGGQLSRN